MHCVGLFGFGNIDAGYSMPLYCESCGAQLAIMEVLYPRVSHWNENTREPIYNQYTQARLKCPNGRLNKHTERWFLTKDFKTWIGGDYPIYWYR